MTMVVKKIPWIHGALARSDGKIKLPESVAEMPNGGFRTYKTKWVTGTRRKAKKTARHEYFGVLHRGKNYKVHRLVCAAFHGNPTVDAPVVIHINEDSTDNRPENLRWGTQKENLNADGFLEYCRSRTGDNSPTIKGMKARVR